MAEKQGCGVVVVIMIAILMLVVGVAVGVGAMFWAVTEDPESLGVEIPTSVPAVPVEVEPAVVAPPEAKPDAKGDYALLYPIEESLRIEGGMEPEIVKTMIKDRRYELRKCYQVGLKKNPDLKGEVGLQFSAAGSNGKVVAAVYRHDEVGDATVKKCVLDEIKKWKFPGKRKGMTVVKFDILMLPISSSAAP